MFKTYYGKYTNGFLQISSREVIPCVFYGIQNDQQYIDKYIYVGGTMIDGVLLVQDVVV
jgi:hypothetical protein